MLRFRASETLVVQEFEMGKMMFEIVYTFIVQMRLCCVTGAITHFLVKICNHMVLAPCIFLNKGEALCLGMLSIMTSKNDEYRSVIKGHMYK